MRAPVLVLGAQRSATTFLYRVLDGHPEIRMARPERPEPKWFLRPESAGADAAAWRAALFGDDVEGVVLGEKSTSYIESDEAAARIGRALPSARLVVSLRDPVERALSNYRFSVVNGVETRDPATALLDGGAVEWDRSRFSVSPYDYLGRSRYVDHLARWDGVAGGLHLVLAEQVVSDRSAVDGLLADLGLAPVPDLEVPDAPVNAAAGPPIPAEVRDGVAACLAASTRALVERYDLPFVDWWPSLAA